MNREEFLFIYRDLDKGTRKKTCCLLQEGDLYYPKNWDDVFEQVLRRTDESVELLSLIGNAEVVKFKKQYEGGGDVYGEREEDEEDDDLL